MLAADDNGRYNGYGVRCVKKRPSYTITLNGDSNVSNFTINGATVAKGGTMSMEQGVTYNIGINYNTGYTAGATPLQKTSGAGTVRCSDTLCQ